MELEALRKNSDVALMTDTDASPLGTDSEIEIVADSAKCHLTLLQLNKSETALMYLSSHSTASTNNTDICVIDESHYGGESRSEPRNFLHMEHSIDAPDFTVLHAPGLQMRLHDMANFDESTEVLDMMSSERNRKSSNPCSGTDSDVEVLMSEEVCDSDWSAGVAACIDELERTPQNMELHLEGGALRSATTTTSSVHHQESTDDISVEEFTHSTDYDHLSRSQLVDLISEQAAHIRLQEKTLQRYRAAQRKLLQHIETFRQECASSPTKPLDDSHETLR